jgi:hypothetical protein
MHPAIEAKREALAALCRRHGVGRTKLYELLGDGSLKGWKLGAKTLIDVETADDFFPSLPSFRQG